MSALHPVAAYKVWCQTIMASSFDTFCTVSQASLRNGVAAREGFEQRGRRGDLSQGIGVNVSVFARNLECDLIVTPIHNR